MRDPKSEVRPFLACLPWYLQFKLISFELAIMEGAPIHPMIKRSMLRHEVEDIWAARFGGM